MQRKANAMLCFSCLLVCTTTFCFAALPTPQALTAEQLESNIISYLLTTFTGDAEHLFQPVGSVNIVIPSEVHAVEILNHSPKTVARRVRVDYRLRTTEGWTSQRSMWFAVQKIQNVYVAIDTIQKHQPLIHNSTRMQSTDVLAAVCEPLLEIPEPRVRARYPISAGEIICQQAFESVPLVELNQQIALLVPKAGFLISAEATALSQGSKGDLIKVRIKQSGLIVSARITDEGLVKYESRM